MRHEAEHINDLAVVVGGGDKPKFVSAKVENQYPTTAFDFHRIGVGVGLADFQQVAPIRQPHRLAPNFQMTFRYRVPAPHGRQKRLFDDAHAYNLYANRGAGQTNKSRAALRASPFGSPGWTPQTALRAEASDYRGAPLSAPVAAPHRRTQAGAPGQFREDWPDECVRFAELENH